LSSTNSPPDVGRRNATLLDNLGIIYKIVGNYTDTEPLLLQALEIRRYTLSEETPDFVTSLKF
jgi:hypothetical protein